MLKETEFALIAVLRGDETITMEQRRDALAILKGQSLVEAAPMDRAMTRAQVAELLGVTDRTVTAIAARGLIRRIPGAGALRKGTRFSGASVREYLNGVPAKCVTDSPTRFRASASTGKEARP